MNKYLVILVLVIFAAFSVIWFTSQPKLGYVNLKEVFENFTYTKKLRSELKLVKEARIKILDSFGFELKLLSEKLKNQNDQDLATVFEVKRKEYIVMERNMLEDNERLTQQYDNKIHSQLASYLVDFGKSEGYDILYGTESLGTILYARDRFNVTTAATEYINKRFTSTKQ
jgi:Skp family chaperone for outer membrane proteins